MNDEEILEGGVHQIRRVGTTVIRPAAAHSETVHRLLRHIRARGFTGAPAPLALDNTASLETLSWVAGATTGYPLADSFRSDRALVTAARLLRQYHDATTDFPHQDEDEWSLSASSTPEVICHGDFAPYNCAVVGEDVTGVFDFDTAHPGTRLDDVGYAAYRWVSLTAPTNSDGFGDISRQAERLALFCRAYGGVSPRSVIDAAIDRLSNHVEYMRQQAADGHPAFSRHVEEGHDQLYISDIAYMTNNKTALTR